MDTESANTNATSLPNGRAPASAPGDDTTRLWQVGRAKLKRTLKGHKAAVRCIAFSPDGRLIASGSDDNTVRLWQASDGTLMRTL
ncbi:MAG: hypothetical protein NZM18_08290 [Thermoflexales bacterium]|nr:hypothetical protein [Thermoflexales bacterium]